MTQEQYDKIVWEKIRRYRDFYDRTTPLLYYQKENTDEGKRLMRLLCMSWENLQLFKARHPEFTATWLKK